MITLGDIGLGKLVLALVPVNKKLVFNPAAFPTSSANYDNAYAFSSITSTNSYLLFSNFIRHDSTSPCAMNLQNLALRKGKELAGHNVSNKEGLHAER